MHYKKNKIKVRDNRGRHTPLAIAEGKRNFVGKEVFFLVILIMDKSSLTFFTNNYMGLTLEAQSMMLGKILEEKTISDVT